MEKTRKTFLIMVSVVVETTGDPSGPGAGEVALDRLLKLASDAVPSLSPGGFQSAWSRELDPSAGNCGQCVECGAWVTDCDRPERIAGLTNGARVDGRLLCDEHLPRGHRWAF